MKTSYQDELTEEESDKLDTLLEGVREDVERAYAKNNAGYSKEKVRMYVQSALDGLGKIKEILLE